MAEDKRVFDYYKSLEEKDELIYRFYLSYASYISKPRDYGSNLSITMVEVHTLTYIYDHPGATVTQISKVWGQTKGAISQNITKLEKRGLIRKEKDLSNSRITHLFVTDEGEQVSLQHKLYDINSNFVFQNQLLKKFTPEEISVFYKILEYTIDII